MISHKHKCIFIHISKCAGSFIESSFGIDVSDNSKNNNPNLFGWNEKHKLYLQHATPQQLIDLGCVSTKQWETYYKFIIVRNPWDRSYSDYFWMINETGIEDSFKNYILRKGNFKLVLNDKANEKYRGDHLKKQIDYFYLNGELIKYNNVIRFENLKDELQSLSNVFSIDFSKNKKVNIGKKEFNHYSEFYNYWRKKLIIKHFSEDIEFLNYSF